jgi:hypothetical protein
MLERGEISFIFLWVLNPIMILFFQNCTWAPPAQVQGSATPIVSQISDREPAMASEKSPGCMPRSNADFCFQ